MDALPITLVLPADAAQVPDTGEPEPLRPTVTRRSLNTLLLSILAAIAVVAALYLARAFFVPLLIGILASYALCPLVDWLEKLRLPRPLGAAVVLVALIGLVGWTTVSMSDDAAAMLEKLPEAARTVRQHVNDARDGSQTALQKLQEAASEFQGAAADAAGVQKPNKATVIAMANRQSEPSVWLRDYMLTQSALLFSVAAQTPIVVLLAYFLLASGVHFRRKLVQVVGPSLSRKKEAVRMLEEIDVQIQRYLLATVGSNVLVGLGTWAAFGMLGMHQAGAWAITVGVLRFVPYLGSALFAIISGMAGYMQFGTLHEALGVAGASLLVATLVGSLVMTWLQSRIARVNAAVLFIALLFFGWLWGIWGLLLGAPLVAITKVICDRVEGLKTLGEMIGH